MLALILRAAGLATELHHRRRLNEVGTNAAYDDGEWMVVEADESDGTFLELPAEAAIVTNVEPDHLDHYGIVRRARAAFEQFVAAVPGRVCRVRRRPDRRELATRRVGIVTFGFADDADYRIVD